MNELTKLADQIKHAVDTHRNGDLTGLLAAVDQLALDHGDRPVRHALVLNLQVSEVRRRPPSGRTSPGTAQKEPSE